MRKTFLPLQYVLVGLGLLSVSPLVGQESLDLDRSEGIYRLAVEVNVKGEIKERLPKVQAALEASARSLLQYEGLTLVSSLEAMQTGDPVLRITLESIEMKRRKRKSIALLRIQLLFRVTVERLATELLLGDRLLPVWKRTLHFEIPRRNAVEKIESTVHYYLGDLFMDISFANNGARQITAFERWKSSQPEEQ